MTFELLRLPRPNQIANDRSVLFFYKTGAALRRDFHARRQSRLFAANKQARCQA